MSNQVGQVGNSWSAWALWAGSWAADLAYRAFCGTVVYAVNNSGAGRVARVATTVIGVGSGVIGLERSANIVRSGFQRAGNLLSGSSSSSSSTNSKPSSNSRSSSQRDSNSSSSRGTPTEGSSSTPPQGAPQAAAQNSVSQSSPPFSLLEFVTDIKQKHANSSWSAALQKCTDALNSGSLKKYDEAVVHLYQYRTLIKQGKANDVIQGKTGIPSAQTVFDSFLDQDIDKKCKLVILKAWAEALDSRSDADGLVNLYNTHKNLIWDGAHKYGKHVQDSLQIQTDIYKSYMKAKITTTGTTAPAANELIQKVNAGYVPQGDHELLASFWASAATLCYFAKKTNEVINYAQRALDEHQNSPCLQNIEKAQLHFFQATSYLDINDNTNAINQALQGDALTFDRSGSLGATLNQQFKFNLLMAYSQVGNFNAALPYIQPAIAFVSQQQAVSEKDLMFYQQCALTYIANGQYSEAIQLVNAHMPQLNAHSVRRSNLNGCLLLAYLKQNNTANAIGTLKNINALDEQLKSYIFSLPEFQNLIIDNFATLMTHNDHKDFLPFIDTSLTLSNLSTQNKGLLNALKAVIHFDKAEWNKAKEAYTAAMTCLESNELAQVQHKSIDLAKIKLLHVCIGAHNKQSERADVKRLYNEKSNVIWGVSLNNHPHKNEIESLQTRIYSDYMFCMICLKEASSVYDDMDTKIRAQTLPKGNLKGVFWGTAAMLSMDLTKIDEAGHYADLAIKQNNLNDSTKAHSYLLCGVKSLKHEKSDEAISFLTEGLNCSSRTENKAQRAGLNYALCIAYSKKGQYSTAVGHLEEAKKSADPFFTKLFENEFQLHLHCAHTYNANNKHQEAIESGEKGLTKAAHNDYAQQLQLNLVLAQSHKAMQSWQKTTDHFAEANNLAQNHIAEIATKIKVAKDYIDFLLFDKKFDKALAEALNLFTSPAIKGSVEAQKEVARFMKDMVETHFDGFSDTTAVLNACTEMAKHFNEWGLYAEAQQVAILGKRVEATKKLLKELATAGSKGGHIDQVIQVSKTPDETIIMAKKGLKLTGDHFEKVKLHITLAKAYQRKILPEEAVASYSEANQIAQEHIKEHKVKSQVSKDYITFLIENKKFDEALTQALHVLNASPNEQKQVAQYINDMVKKHDADFKDQNHVAKACLRLAQLYNQLGMHKEAQDIANFGKNKQIAEEVKLSLLNEIITSASKLGTLNQTLELSQTPDERIIFAKESLKSIKSENEKIALHLTLAKAYKEKKELKKAISQYEQAFELAQKYVNDSKELLNIGFDYINGLLGGKKSDKALAKALTLFELPVIKGSKEGLNALIKATEEIIQKHSGQIEKKNNLAKANLEIAKLQNQWGAHAEALTSVNRGLALKAKESTTIALLVEHVIANAKLGSIDQVIDSCKKALDKGPSAKIKEFFLQEASNAWAKKKEKASNKDEQARACLEQATVNFELKNYKISKELAKEGLGYGSSEKQVRHGLKQIAQTSHDLVDKNYDTTDDETTTKPAVQVPAKQPESKPASFKPAVQMPEKTLEQRLEALKPSVLGPLNKPEPTPAPSLPQPVLKPALKPVVQMPAKLPESKPASLKPAVQMPAKQPEPTPASLKPAVQMPAKQLESKPASLKPAVQMPAKQPEPTPAPVLPLPIFPSEEKPSAQGPENTPEFKLVFNSPEVLAPKPTETPALKPALKRSGLERVNDLPPLPQPQVDQKQEPSTPRGAIFRSISSDSPSSELPPPIVEDFPEETKDTAQSRPKRNVKKSPASTSSEKPIPEAPPSEGLTFSKKPITFVADLYSIDQQKGSLKTPEEKPFQKPKPVVEKEPQELTNNPEKMQSLAPPKQKEDDPDPVRGLITRTPEQMKAYVASQYQSSSDSNNGAFDDSSSDKDKPTN